MNFPTIKFLILFLAGFISMTASARTMEFKVLELDQNQTGPYALFSGGKIDGLAVGDEVCVQKNPSKGSAFCTKIVSLRKRAAAFYIPAGHETDVAMGSIVTFKSAKEADSVAAPETSENLEPVQSPSKPWFFPAQHFDVGYHLQITSAVETNAVSFQALPRDPLNSPWTKRKALNLAPLGLGFGYARDFLREGNHLGIRGFYSQSQKGSFDNDYDLSDVDSHVESDTVASTLGLALFYGIDRGLAENAGYRASGGMGIRRSSTAVSSNLKGTTDATLVSGTIIATAPVVEIATGARYKIFDVQWTADLMVAVPLSVTTTTTGTFNSVQDVTTDEVKANVKDAVGCTKGFEISVGLGLTKAF
ncbi:MAG: hypothetical protein EBU49_05450 [Proteobacteria bacterium]|nr:hypothetical protein [Pseudomonadota bacterium]